MIFNIKMLKFVRIVQVVKGLKNLIVSNNTANKKKSKDYW